MKRRLHALPLNLLVLALTSACGHVAGTKPHDMGAAHHQARAHHEEHQAREHIENYDPAATSESERCGFGKRPACWKDVTNPTAEHLAQATRHRELATKHRAASSALLQAEATSCSGLSDLDRDMSPFAHNADIRRVQQLFAREVLESADDSPDRPTRSGQLSGATVILNPVRGMTAELLQRIVDCHLARARAAGHQVPELPYCPLVAKGATAKVRSVGNGFAIDVESPDRDAAKEIWRRASSLKDPT